MQLPRPFRRSRRKSRIIRLALMGSVGLVGLTGCDDKDPTAGHDVLRDQAQCASQADPDACRMALADARDAHLRGAPRFASRQDCEDRFGLGNCGTPETIVAAAGPAADEPVPPGQPAASQQQHGSVFMPMLMGYMLGRNLGGPGVAGSAWTAQPLYRDPDNVAYSGGRSLGTLSANRFPGTPQATPASIARGGFGRTGRLFSVAG